MNNLKFRFISSSSFGDRRHYYRLRPYGHSPSSSSWYLSLLLLLFGLFLFLLCDVSSSTLSSSNLQQRQHDVITVTRRRMTTTTTEGGTHGITNKSFSVFNGSSQADVITDLLDNSSTTNNNSNHSIFYNNNSNASSNSNSSNSNNNSYGYNNTPPTNNNYNRTTNNTNNPPQQHKQNNAYEFVAFLLWYLFLVLCCVIPTCCAYRRRRNAEYRAALEQQQQHQIHLAEQFVQHMQHQQQHSTTATPGGGSSNDIVPFLSSGGNNPNDPAAATNNSLFSLLSLSNSQRYPTNNSNTNNDNENATSNNNNNGGGISNTTNNDDSNNNSTNTTVNPMTGFPFIVRGGSSSLGQQPAITDIDQLRIERSRVFLRELKSTTMVVMNDHIETQLHQEQNHHGNENRIMTEEDVVVDSDVATTTTNHMTAATTTAESEETVMCQTATASTAAPWSSSALEHHTTYDEFINNNDHDDEYHHRVTIRLYGDGPNGNRTVPALCAICLCQYEEGDSVSWSPVIGCQHVFHTDCIVEWLSKKQPNNTISNNNADEHGGESKCPLCRLEYCPSALSSLQELDARYHQSLHIQQLRQQQLAFTNYERLLFSAGGSNRGNGDLHFISTASFLESFTQALALSHFYRTDQNNNNPTTIVMNNGNTNNTVSTATLSVPLGTAAPDGDGVANIMENGSRVMTILGSGGGGGTTSATMAGTTGARGQHRIHGGRRRAPVFTILHPHASPLSRATSSTSVLPTSNQVPGTTSGSRRRPFSFHFPFSQRNQSATTSSSSTAGVEMTASLPNATPIIEEQQPQTPPSTAAVLTYSRTSPPTPPFSRALDVFDNNLGSGIVIPPHQLQATNHSTANNNNIRTITDTTTLQQPHQVDNNSTDSIPIPQPQEREATSATTAIIIETTTDNGNSLSNSAIANPTTIMSPTDNGNNSSHSYDNTEAQGTPATDDIE